MAGYTLVYILIILYVSFLERIGNCIVGLTSSYLPELPLLLYEVVDLWVVALIGIVSIFQMYTKFYSSIL